MTEFKFTTAQVQFWAEIGTVDDTGRIDNVDKREAFPTKEEAETWLDEQGWPYNSQLLRRAKKGHPYGAADTWRVLEYDKDKWITREEDNMDGQ